MKRRARLIVAASLAFVALLVWLLLRTPSDEAAAQAFAKHLQGKEWAAIYDMASDLEKSRQPWRKTEYVALMKELSRTCCSNIGPITVKQDWAGRTTMRIYTFTFSGTRVGNGPEKTTFEVTFRKDLDGWHPAIYSLPLYMHNLRKQSTRQSLRKLLAAAKKARVAALARLDDNLLFSFDRLQQYLDGDIKWQAVYTHRPNVEALRKLAQE